MRLKPYFTITLSLTAMLLVGCNQQDTSLNAPEIASVSLAKGGDKGKPGGGGGAEEATFTVTFKGDVAGGPLTITRKLREGGNIITTDPHDPIELDLIFAVANCFDADTYIGPLMIREAKKNADHTAEVLFFFNAKGTGTDETTDIDYLLEMFGTIENPDNWPPASGTTNTVTFDAWEMGTESNKVKNACTGIGFFDNTTTNTTTVEVKRL